MNIPRPNEVVSQTTQGVKALIRELEYWFACGGYQSAATVNGCKCFSSSGFGADEFPTAQDQKVVITQLRGQGWHATFEGPFQTDRCLNGLICPLDGSPVPEPKPNIRVKTGGYEARTGAEWGAPVTRERMLEEALPTETLLVGARNWLSKATNELRAGLRPHSTGGFGVLSTVQSLGQFSEIVVSQIKRVVESAGWILDTDESGNVLISKDEESPFEPTHHALFTDFPTPEEVNTLLSERQLNGPISLSPMRVPLQSEVRRLISDMQDLLNDGRVGGSFKKKLYAVTGLSASAFLPRPETLPSTANPNYFHEEAAFKIIEAAAQNGSLGMIVAMFLRSCDQQLRDRYLTPVSLKILSEKARLNNITVPPVSPGSKELMTLAREICKAASLPY